MKTSYLALEIAPLESILMARSWETLWFRGAFQTLFIVLIGIFTSDARPQES